MKISLAVTVTLDDEVELNEAALKVYVESAIKEWGLQTRRNPLIKSIKGVRATIIKEMIPIHEARALGGKVRAERLSPKRRKEIASAAAKARWDRKKEDS